MKASELAVGDVAFAEIDGEDRIITKVSPAELLVQSVSGYYSTVDQVDHCERASAIKIAERHFPASINGLPPAG